MLGERIEDVVPVERKYLKSPSEPPKWDWQHRTERIVSQAEETLWSEAGEPALNYLTGRGLTPRTIRTARLGYVPGDFRSWRVLEGMDVPCGITHPLVCDGCAVGSQSPPSLWHAEISAD